MLNGKKIIVVLPAYNAAKTLEKTVREIPPGLADEILVVDDCSSDETVEVAKRLGLKTLRHEKNLGYGGNQKTCYRTALDSGADVVVMLHPDYQYDPRILPALASPVCSGVYDVMLGSRILRGNALEGGMPFVKYFMNRLLTFFQNIVYRRKLSEYHTGYRAFSRKALGGVAFGKNNNDFGFDTQILAQLIYAGFSIGEISCPTRYFPEASSISYRASMIYTGQCIGTMLKFLLQKSGLSKFSLFEGKTL